MSDSGYMSRRQDDPLPGAPNGRALRRSPPTKARRLLPGSREERGGKTPTTRLRLRKTARHEVTPRVILPLPPLSLYRRVWLT